MMSRGFPLEIGGYSLSRSVSLIQHNVVAQCVRPTSSTRGDAPLSNKTLYLVFAALMATACTWLTVESRRNPRR